MLTQINANLLTFRQSEKFSYCPGQPLRLGQSPDWPL